MHPVPDCPICESRSDIVQLPDKNGHSMHQCGGCTHIFVSPIPSAEELDRIYSDSAGYMADAAALARASIPEKFIQRIELLRAQGGSGRLLDVGCSFGQFLRLARDNGYDASGVEINAHTAAVARELGFEVSLGTLEEVALPDAAFDVIHLGDLIEHVPDIALLLREARRLLREGGLLILTTPNHDAFFPRATRRFGRVLGVPWSHPTPPHHLHQFSRSSLDALFGRIGFRALDARYESIPLGYEIRATGAPSSLKRALGARRPSGVLRHGVITGLAVVGYSVLALLERTLKEDAPRATMTVVASPTAPAGQGP